MNKQNKKRSLNQYRIKFVLFLVLTLIYSVGYAQPKQISGNVTDKSTGEALPGVTILVKGTTLGTITDFDGIYNFKAEPGQTLVFSFIGYTPQELVIGEESVINVQLAQSTKDLDEVIVIGYGTVKKDDATGSVEVINADDFNQGAITSPQELLSGKSSGVVITSNDGAPGAGSQIRIRGGSSMNASNDPLIVIDGFPVESEKIDGFSNPLAAINPNDIESMTVLKDASATAIYGSRASNGVIIITTKKGGQGGLKVTYNGNVSLKTIASKIDVLGADEFKSIVEDRVANYDLTEVALSRLGNANTNWQDEIYRNSISTDHNVSVSGSKKDIPYRVSIGYTADNGLLKESGIDRYSGTIAVNPKFFENHLKVDFNLKAVNIATNFSNTDAIGSSVQFDPTQPVMNGNTRYGGYTAWTLLNDNPLNGDPINIATSNPAAQIAFRDNTSNAIRGIGNLQLDYKFHFLPELRANLNVGYDYVQSKGDDITNPKASWSYREPEQNIKEYEHITKNELFDFYLNYVKDIDFLSSNIDVTAGYSYQHFYKEGYNNNKGWDDTEWVIHSPYKSEYYLASFFGRLNYSILDRYLFTATLRNDGSSRFNKDNRWGLFPAFAFAWKIKDESFLKDVDLISDLKLRLGYGVTGQQNIDDNYYPYMPVYEVSERGAYYQFGDKFYPTWRPGRYDANIKWEETTTQNVGLDFSFLKGRISGTFDVYKKETVDLINEVPIDAGTNFSNFLVTNVGSLENKGFEIGLNGKIISKEDMVWEVGANISHNVNKITQLTTNDDPAYVGDPTGDIAGGVGNTVQINAVGHPVNTFFLFKQVYDIDGNPIEGLYIDKTGEGGDVSGNNTNKYYLKTPAPDYAVGISSMFRYKNIDVSFSGRMNIGNYVYNNNSSNTLYQSVYNQAGYLANLPRFIYNTNFTTAQYWSDFYLENASFFRMDNINVGYSFDNVMDWNIPGRVGFTVQNAFVITKYSGIDPEVTDGIDDNIYPRPRTFMMSVNLNF